MRLGFRAWSPVPTWILLALPVACDARASSSPGHVANPSAGATSDGGEESSAATAGSPSVIGMGGAASAGRGPSAEAGAGECTEVEAGSPASLPLAVCLFPDEVPAAWSSAAAGAPSSFECPPGSTDTFVSNGCVYALTSPEPVNPDPFVSHPPCCYRGELQRCCR